jgi:hypothetical protein
MLYNTLERWIQKSSQRTKNHIQGFTKEKRLLSYVM